MNMRFEAEQTQRFKRALDLRCGGMTIVLFAYLLIKTLNAHLDLGTAKTSKNVSVLRDNALGARFYN